MREDEYDIRVLRLVRSGNASPLLEEIRTLGSDYRPAYITSTTENAIVLSGNDTTLTQVSFAPNLINTATCGSNQRITLKPASGSTAAFQNFVLVTKCELQISGTVELQNVVLFTTSTPGPP